MLSILLVETLLIYHEKVLENAINLVTFVCWVLFLVLLSLNILELA